MTGLIGIGHILNWVVRMAQVPPESAPNAFGPEGSLLYAGYL